MMSFQEVLIQILVPTIIAIIIIVGSILIKNLIARAVLNLVFLSLAKKDKTQAVQLKEKLEKPLSWFLCVFIWKFALAFFTVSPAVLSILKKSLDSILIVLAIWLLYDFLQHVLTMFQAKNQEASTKNSTAWNYLRSAILVVIFIFGILLVLNQWIDNLDQLLTGLGISGIVIALAAQDTASNLVAGIAIMLDKPFDIGDWIETNSSTGPIVGTVIGIGLRSSRVKSLDGSTLTVPNSLLGAAVIVNGTERSHRMANMRLPMDANIAGEVLEDFRQKALDILKADGDILPDSPSVHMIGFERDAIIWQIRFQTDVEFSTFLECRHRMTLQLMKLTRELGIKLAAGIEMQ